MFVVIPVPIFADPIPNDPLNPNTVLPKVFCIRITDIRADNADPENNKFTFEFEVLNWSDSFASDVHFSLAGPDTSGVIFMGAGIDEDGRPLIPWPVGGPFVPAEDTNGDGILDPGEDINGDGRLTNDPLPGSFTSNNWVVEGSSLSDTNIVWEAAFSEGEFESLSIIPLAYAGMSGGEISPLNILGSTGTQASVNDLLLDNIPSIDSIDAAGNVFPMEAIDDGFNALDGFTFTVDNFDDGDTFQINWFLSEFGDPIGTSGNGNQYGFGIINLARSDGGGFPGPVFTANTGFGQSQLEFYDSIYNTESAIVVVGFEMPTIIPLAYAGGIGQPGFSVEFGAGITAKFLESDDNVFDAEINAMVNQVGGGIIPIESTSLILAGAQSFSWMIPVVLSILGIGLFVVSRKN